MGKGDQGRRHRGELKKHRMRYCGMGGKINSYLTIRRANPKCKLDGLMENGQVEE